MSTKTDLIYSRLPLILLMFGWGLLHLLVAFGNMTDYGTNFEFVKHVLSMDTIFPIAVLDTAQLPIQGYIMFFMYSSSCLNL